MKNVEKLRMYAAAIPTMLFILILLVVLIVRTKVNELRGEHWRNYGSFLGDLEGSYH